MKTIKTCKQAPRKPAKRLQATQFNKKASTYLGYTTHFLKDNAIVKLIDPVKVVRCKTGNGIRLGLANLCNEDKTAIMEQERQLITAFNGISSKFRSLFPTAVDIEETGRDMIFVNTTNNGTTLFNGDRERVPLVDALPRVSTCRIALAFVGIKVKENEVSPMVRAHQLMIANNDDAEDDEGGCMFTDEE